MLAAKFYCLIVVNFVEDCLLALFSASEWLLSFIANPIVNILGRSGMSIDPTAVYILLAAVVMMLIVLFGNKLGAIVFLIVVGTAIYLNHAVI
jgi:hypothetical protein